MTTTWPMVPLSEIAEPISRPVSVIAGESYRTIGVKWWGEGAYERETIDGSRTAAKTLSFVREGDLIINKIWVRHGSTAIATKAVDGCAASGEFPTFKLDQDRVVPRWIHWQTKTRDFWIKCDALSRGTSGKNRIKPELFLTIKVPLPPIPEQRRIVARIEELSAKIDEARAFRERVTSETGALTSAFSKILFTRNDSVRSDRLETFVNRITKGESPEWQGFSYQDSGPTFVRSENVLWGVMDRSKRVCIPPEFHEKLNRSQLKPRDVLINLVGASIGRACVVPDDIAEANVNQAVAVITPDHARLDCTYLMHFLISPMTQDVIHGGKVETARPNISLGDLRSLLISVPSLSEQHRIVAYLDDLKSKVDTVKKLQQESEQGLNALVPSILSRAFSGEL